MTTDVATPAARREALAEEVLELMATFKRRLAASLPPELREDIAGVTAHQLEALRHLRDGEATAAPGATMQELARAQQCALSTMTALADRLIRQGLAERRPDPDDRRVVHLVPTARGEQLSDHFDRGRRRLALEMASALSDDELATFVQLMRKVAAGGDATEGAP